MAYKNHIAKYNNSQEIQDAVNNGNLEKPYVALAGNALDFNTKVVFDVDAQDMEFPASGGTSAITITASQDWTITLPAWLSASTLSGNSSQEVTVSATTTQQAHEGTISVSAATTAVTINVEQAEPVIDYSTMYFTIEALQAGQFTSDNAPFSYSINGGEWTATDYETPMQVQVQAGDKIRFKAESDICVPSFTYEMMDFDFNCYGNIMSLLYGDNFVGQTTLTGGADHVFSDNIHIISAEHLILPATTLIDRCYEFMFGGCYNLTTPPALPALTLADYCYSNMFAGCTGLTSFPALPATTLAEGCYSGMFNGCYGMETSPVLPALTLADSCYYGMFMDCGNLMNVTCLATDISAIDCLTTWLDGVSFVGTLHKNPLPTNVWEPGVNIPEEWTVEDYSA